MPIQSTVTPATVTLADLREVVAIAVGKHPDQRGRIERAAAIVALKRIERHPDCADTTCVESDSEPGVFHEVDTAVWVCTCRDATYRGTTCSHQWAVRLLRALLITNAGRPALAEVA